MGRPLDGFKATKEIGAGQDGPLRLLSMVQNLTTISSYVRIIRFKVAWVDPLWGGILLSRHCRCGWGLMGLMANDLWDVSRRGIAKLHVDCGGYWVPLELPIDLNEAHRSNHVVMVDKPLPAWGEIECAYNQASRPLWVEKDAREKRSEAHAALMRIMAKPRLPPPRVSGR